MGIKGTTTSTNPAQVKIELELDLKVNPQQAYAAFADIGNWWQGGEFQVGREKSIDMRLNAIPGGFWMEDWGNGDFHIWATVISVQSGRLLRLAIPSGAQWSAPGNVEVEFIESTDGCQLRLIHRCIQVEGMAWDHEAYIPHWQTQVAERFRLFAETGTVDDSVRGTAAVNLA